MARRDRTTEDPTKAWVKQASVIDGRSWGSWRNAEGTRRLVALYHNLINGCPANELQLFDQFDEAELATKAGNLMAFPLRRDKVRADEDGETALRKLAQVLRMLDTVLLEEAEGAVSNPEEEWSVEECDCYVVPIAHFGMNRDRARTGQTFSRRGILRHRVISRRIAGADIRLTVHPDYAGSNDRIEASPPTFGAAIFPDFRFEYRELPKNRFVLEKVECGGGIETVMTAQMDAFRKSRCDIVVWPELTVHEDVRKHVVGLLEADADPRPKPDVVVAGSWHVEDDDGRYYNESVVYDGRGDRILSYDKMRIFRYEGLHEAIEPGGHVEVLVWDDKLLAFAICKDFCDRAKSLPVIGLDVDLAIVPSMGELKTLESHAVAANDMKILFGTRTFVVQQTVPVEGLADGYVMSLPTEPLKEAHEAMETRGEFTTFQLIRRNAR